MADRNNEALAGTLVAPKFGGGALEDREVESLKDDGRRQNWYEESEWTGPEEVDFIARSKSKIVEGIEGGGSAQIDGGPIGILILVCEAISGYEFCGRRWIIEQVVFVSLRCECWKKSNKSWYALLHQSHDWDTAWIGDLAGLPALLLRVACSKSIFFRRDRMLVHIT